MMVQQRIQGHPSLDKSNYVALTILGAGRIAVGSVVLRTSGSTDGSDGK